MLRVFGQMRCFFALLLTFFAGQAVGKPPAPPFSSCINLSNALEAPHEGLWGYRIRGRDINLIAASGFDAVRIPIRWSEHTEQHPPFSIDPEFFARVDTVVQSAIAAGLYAVINVHHFDDFSEDPSHNLPRLEAIWRQIAQRYSNEDERLIFELLNEPHIKANAATMNRVNRRLVEEIRWRLVLSG